MTTDQALKQAGDIIIAAFPDMYGSITFNLQGQRKSVHCNVNEKLVVDTESKDIDIDIKESKKL